MSREEDIYINIEVKYCRKCYLLKFCIFNPYCAEYIKMSCPLLIFSQSNYLIKVVDTNSHTKWQTVQIQISWLLKKPTDLDLHCLQRQVPVRVQQDQG